MRLQIPAICFLIFFSFNAFGSICDRHAELQEAILRHFRGTVGKKSCSDITQSDLARISYLELNWIDRDFTPRDFDGLTNLRELHFDQIAFAAPNSLEKLPQLEELRIKRPFKLNGIKALIKPLNKLKRLRLGSFSNHPKSIKNLSEALESNASLKTLAIDHLGFSEFAYGAEGLSPLCGHLESFVAEPWGVYNLSSLLSWIDKIGTCNGMPSKLHTIAIIGTPGRNGTIDKLDSFGSLGKNSSIRELSLDYWSYSLLDHTSTLPRNLTLRLSRASSAI